MISMNEKTEIFPIILLELVKTSHKTNAPAKTDIVEFIAWIRAVNWTHPFINGVISFSSTTQGFNNRTEDTSQHLFSDGTLGKKCTERKKTPVKIESILNVLWTEN